MKDKLQYIILEVYGRLSRETKNDYLHIIAGMFIASAVAILLPKIATYCIIFALGAGISKAFIYKGIFDEFRVPDIWHTAFGGLLIEIIAIVKQLI